ncbi:hypothetical protein DFH06DRAFT_1466330 [Mycena polygramma]|nr:hypothetical protein DFH06DRAFT_1466330 [Mycena polygramma]
MFSSKSLFAAVSAALLIATVGFVGTTNCGCPASNGPFAVSIPSALVGTHVCCDESITISFNGKSVDAVFNGIFDAGAGTQNIQLSQVAFDAIEDNSGETSLSPVTWAFD